MSEQRRKYEKHPYPIRLQVVSKVLTEHLPIRTTAKLFGVNPRQVKLWTALYSRYGEEGLRIQSRYYPLDFKHKVLHDMFNNHLTLQQASVKYGIPSPSTILVWKRKYDDTGLSGLNAGSRLWSEDRVIEDINPMEQENKGAGNNEKEKKSLLKEIELLKAEN